MRASRGRADNLEKIFEKLFKNLLTNRRLYGIIDTERTKKERNTTLNTRAIYFDMDGTIADLYGVPDWLAKLRACNPTPYAEAPPLLKLQPLARVLNSLQRKGYTIGIISWLSKEPNPEYDEQVTKAKQEWLKTHLKSVQFDEIVITAHGTPKQKSVQNPFGILFDDEEKNRKDWLGKAYEPENIMNILKALA